VSLATE